MHDMIKKILKEKRKEFKGRRSSLLQRDASHSQKTSQKKSSLAKQKFAPSTQLKKKSKFLIQLQKNSRLLHKNFAIIGELKFASPSAGNMASSKELIKRARAYEKAGVDAISVITEKHFFRGDIAFVQKIKKAVKLPVLQKDFVIDASQIREAKEVGSDGLLLIARIVTKKKLQIFVDLCIKIGIEPVVEVYSNTDLQKAIQTNTRTIAVNARDLDTFKVDVAKACLLMQQIPVQFTRIGFSGIVSKTEAVLYKRAGAKAILIGTAFMRKMPTKKEVQILKGIV